MIILVNDTTLSIMIAMIERSQKRAIGSKLVDEIATQRSVPYIALTIDAQAIAIMAIACPIDAICPRRVDWQYPSATSCGPTK